jgi:hypothetical protein
MVTMGTEVGGYFRRRNVEVFWIQLRSESGVDEEGDSSIAVAL